MLDSDNEVQSTCSNGQGNIHVAISVFLGCDSNNFRARSKVTLSTIGSMSRWLSFSIPRRFHQSLNKISPSSEIEMASTHETLCKALSLYVFGESKRKSTNRLQVPSLPREQPRARSCSPQLIACSSTRGQRNRYRESNHGHSIFFA